MDVTFPVLKLPGAEFIAPIHALANAMAKQGGQLKEIWVSWEIYDRLTAEILAVDRLMIGSNEHKWKNGLIIIHTAHGKVKIRLDE